MVDSNDSNPNNLADDKILAGLPEVDGYKVLEPVVIYSRIGQGGMGSVYRGRHLGLDIDVAIKCLKSGLAEESEEFVIRFKREARVAATINSPHLIRVFDVNESNGIHYLIMEFVRGESARERVERKGPLSLDEAVTIIRSAAKGLTAAHAKGAVHRDIKPDNIMISTEGEVKVADLGLAKAADGIDNLETRSGMVMGTPSYMPPEQYGDVSKVGPSGDVYSLAATLYYLLAGQNAVSKGTLVEVMYKVCQGEFPDIGDRRPELPPKLSEVIAKATAKDPLDRYQTTLEFARALEPFASKDIDKDELHLVLREKGLTRKFNDENLLVSPPPQQTIARIKMKLNEPHQERTAKPEASTVKSNLRTEIDHSGATTISPQHTRITPVQPKKSKAPALLIAIILLVGGAVGGGYWWLNQQDQPQVTKDEQAKVETTKENSAVTDPTTAETIKEAGLDVPIKEREEAPPTIKPIDYVEMFDQAQTDVKRYATLETGIEKFRRIKKEATDVIGVNEALSDALLTLGQKKQEDGQLNAAMIVIREAIGIDGSERAVALDKDISDAIDGIMGKSLSVDSPKDGAVLADLNFRLTGRINEIALNAAGLEGSKLTIGGEDIPITTGLFSHELMMPEEGSHAIDLVMTTPLGHAMTRSFRVISDQSDPVIAINMETSDLVPSKEGIITLKGTLSDATTCNVEITARHESGSEQKKKTEVFPGNESWEVAFAIADGKTDFEVVAIDQVGRKATVTYSTSIDESAPVLTLTMAKGSGQLTDKRNLKLEGTISDKSACTVSIQARSQSGQLQEKNITVAAGENPWSADFQLSDGRTTFTITAKDSTDREDQVTYDVIVDLTSPTLIVDAIPQETDAGSITIRGRANDINGVYVDINGTAVNTAATGSFQSQQNLRIGNNTFRIQARDNLNHMAVKTLSIQRRNPLPTQIVSQIRAQHNVNLISIKSGSFLMGSLKSEAGHDDDEVRHRVVLSKDFYMSQTEVTRGQWSRVMASKPWEQIRNNPSIGVGIGGLIGGRARIRTRTTPLRQSNQIAVSNVTYDDAMIYCEKLNRQFGFSGWEFRLPTEAEWEYCCRGGRPTAYSFGDGPRSKLKDYGYFEDNSKNARVPMDVNMLRANEWGLSDMHGNAGEWCLDWYGPYNPRGATDPKGPANGTKRVARGGNVESGFRACRSANRNSYTPSERSAFRGFRIVLAPR